ncbi:MAG: hypothetical protein JRH20_29625 [Deltaproteobacteria bacterium]|nr:hypothetical protein [Deltaproteobacteria bacterium]
MSTTQQALIDKAMELAGGKDAVMRALYNEKAKAAFAAGESFETLYKKDKDLASWMAGMPLKEMMSLFGAKTSTSGGKRSRMTQEQIQVIQERIVALVVKNRVAISKGEIAAVVGIPAEKLTNYLKILKDKKLLTMQGEKKSARYVAGPKASTGVRRKAKKPAAK